MTAQPRNNVATGTVESAWSTFPEQMKHEMDDGNGTVTRYYLSLYRLTGVCGDGVCSPSELLPQSDWLYVKCAQDCDVVSSAACSDSKVPLYTRIGLFTQDGYFRNAATNISGFDAARCTKYEPLCSTFVVPSKLFQFDRHELRVGLLTCL